MWVISRFPSTSESFYYFLLLLHVALVSLVTVPVAVNHFRRVDGRSSHRNGAEAQGELRPKDRVRDEQNYKVLQEVFNKLKITKGWRRSTRIGDAIFWSQPAGSSAASCGSGSTTGSATMPTTSPNQLSQGESSTPGSTQKSNT
ncbi:hypothetical protein RHGRI_030710 [Rhododendron griersonianum]|uniref:Uncharacterized protein n=1 Tax=Rhododendron griersonianum TaxID=479676 RepID=A0AAV6I558_9ERIC|nr:hypothetical protein RHGRI_030710 [Rhododendron griersonianum]